MIYKALIQIILLTLATEKTTASKNAIRIQQAFNKMVEAMQTTVNSKENLVDTESDETLINFLGNIMGTYNNWLAIDDPLRPDPTEITLSTTGPNGKLGNELDAVLKLSNQRMVDHSRSGPSLVFPFSKNSQNNLAVARAVLDGPDVIFTGDYTTTGVFKVSPSLSIPFKGKGWWTFYGNDMAEIVTYEGYTVNQNGTVNISATLSTKYMCLITWNDVEFRGLQLDYHREIDATWMSRLQSELAELYAVFLKDPLAFENFQNHVPPKRLLNEYLEENLVSVKINKADAFERVQRTTLLAISGQASYIQESNILIVLVMFAVCYNVLI